MRDRVLIKQGSPCYNDFSDTAMQTIADAKKIGPVPCSNLAQCQDPSKGIFCYRQFAQQMAGFVLGRSTTFEQDVKLEKQDLLHQGVKGKFWVFRDEQWQVVSGKIDVVIEDIVAYARQMIDRKAGERRPFTQDGKRIELNPSDAIKNAALDLNDIYAEVGQQAPKVILYGRVLNP